MSMLDAVSHADLDALQGDWLQVAHAADGIEEPADAYHRADVFTRIEVDRFCVRSEQGEVLLHGRFELDATTSPKSITWFDAVGPDVGRPLPASYRLDGDSFDFIAADCGCTRPLRFHTEAGQVMRRFRRLRGSG